MNVNKKEFSRRQDVPSDVAIVHMNHDRHQHTFAACRKEEAVRPILKDRDEDLALIDRFLMPMAFVTALLGMGSGLLICFLVW